MYKIEVLATSQGGNWTALLAAHQPDVEEDILEEAIELAGRAREIGAVAASGEGFKVQVLTGRGTPDTALGIALAHARQKMKPCNVTLVTDDTVDDRPWRRQGFRVRQESLHSHPLRGALEKLYDL